MLTCCGNTRPRLGLALSIQPWFRGQLLWESSFAPALIWRETSRYAADHLRYWEVTVSRRSADRPQASAEEERVLATEPEGLLGSLWAGSDPAPAVERIPRTESQMWTTPSMQ